MLLTALQMLKITKKKDLSKEDLNKSLADVCPMGVQQRSDADFIDEPVRYEKIYVQKLSLIPIQQFTGLHSLRKMHH
jgi:hypothetical protein